MAATPAPHRDARRDHRRRRPVGPRRRRRTRRRRQARRDRRAGARGEPRRAGALVVRRPVPHRLARAAPHGREGLARAREAGLGRHGRVRPRRGRVGAPLGRGLPRVRRGREARLAAREGRAVLPRSSAGPSAAATTPSATATRCRASTSRGAPDRACSPRSSRACRPAQPRASSSSGTGTASTSSSSSPARSSACAAQCSKPDAAGRGEPSNRDVVGDFELRAPAVVVASGGIGGNHDLVREFWPERMGIAPEELLSGVPAHVDGRMLPHRRARGRAPRQRRPHVALHRGHHELGPGLAEARHPHPARARRRCGSTPRAGACRCRSSPASTRSARSSTSCRPVTTTRGSCSRRRSSRRSSRSRAASRTPTSPART